MSHSTMLILSLGENSPTENSSFDRSLSGTSTSMLYFYKPLRREKSSLLLFASHTTSMTSPTPNGKQFSFYCLSGLLCWKVKPRAEMQNDPWFISRAVFGTQVPSTL